MRRITTTVAITATGVLLLAGCGSADPEEVTAPTGEPGAVSTATPEASEVVGGTVDPSASASPEASTAAGADLTAPLLDVAGTEVGTMTATEVAGGLEITVEATALEPGFHGMHLHAVGLCEPESAAPTDPGTLGAFLSAGGHIGAGDTSHGAHPGDLPSLLVTAAGTGSVTAVTDGLALADVLDADGSALMVHAGPDNFANVPERYAPEGPDQTTLDTGDSGGRVACGAVTP